GGPETPWDSTPEPDPDLHELTALDDYLRLRDAAGTLTGEQIRKLTVDATGAEPWSGDEIAVGVAKDAVTPDTKFAEITKVTKVAPGGVPLMYELELAS
ncbi:MAG: hypothetical protein AB3N24_05995, partial [Leisingera sp.]